MTKGCGILVALVTSTWPRHAVWSFSAPPSTAFRSIRRIHSCSPRCSSWPDSPGQRQPRFDRTSSSFPSGTVNRQRGGASTGVLVGWVARSTVAALAGSEGQGDGSGVGGGRYSLDVDAEALARAREAAKNDDYDWFMEFIGSDEDVGGPQEKAKASPSSMSDQNPGPPRSSDSRGSRAGGKEGSSYNREDLNRRVYQGSGGYDSNDRGEDFENIFIRETPRATPPPPPLPRGRRSPLGQERSFSQSDRVNMRPSGARPTAADRAYDYDLDEEFDGEVGRGGWEYDPGFTPGVAARQRDVEVGRVRARAKVAARPAPLEEDVKERASEDVAEVPSAPSGSEIGFEPVGAETASTLTGDLGYTEEEAACIDPDMADLAIERGIRRPASGMPPDWVAVGAALTPSVSQRSKRGALNSEKTADTGALDLDEILYGGEYSDQGQGGRGGSRQNRPRVPSPFGSGERRGELRQDFADRGNYDFADGSDGGGDGYISRRRPRRRELPYYEEDQRAYDRRDRVERDDYDDRYYDDYNDENDDETGPRGWDEDRSRRRRPRQRARPRRELNPAEKYERKLLGRRGEEDEEEEEGKIWTGVGPDGPWPTLEEFTKLLREETDVRLSLVGPWAAEVVALENAFRLNAYKKWLDVLDKGIGESLEEAGVFDAAFPTEEDRADDLYDNYTNYETGRRREYGYDPRGREDERGMAYDERRAREGRRRRRSRLDADDSGEERSTTKFDVGSFLRSGAQSLMQPAAGLEEAAARFEREYPGRRRRTTEEALKDDRDIEQVSDGRGRPRPPRREWDEGFDGSRGGSNREYRDEDDDFDD